MIHGFFPEKEILASGTGKTLAMVRSVMEQITIIDKEKNIKREVLSNIHLTQTPYTGCSAKTFTDKNVTLHSFANLIIVLDEMQQFIDARSGLSTKSLTIQNNIILQNRHQTTDIFYTYQDISMADVRLRRATGYFYFCRPLDRIGEKSTRFLVTVYSAILGEWVYQYEFSGFDYFNFYNTKEFVGDGNNG